MRGDEETGQTIIAGMGELHLEIILDRLLREFRVDANIGRPQVAYRETVRAAGRERRGPLRQADRRPRPVRPRRHQHRAQRRGRLRVREQDRRRWRYPQGVHPERGQGHPGGASTGVVAGYPVVDVRVELVDGSYHEVDSSEMAFQIAGSMAAKEARANPTLLEPIMDVEVVVPEEFMGDVMGDLSSRRGHIQGMDSSGGGQVIRAMVPLSEMFGYATTVRSKTQGRATFTMQFDHYAEVPKSIAAEISEG